jgi:DNA-binding NarL/FixJ family response regulator
MIERLTFARRERQRRNKLPDVLLVVDDLFFLAKIQQTAKLTGISVETVAPATLHESIAEKDSRGAIRGVVIDLNHRSGSAVDLIRGLKSDPSTAALPVLGFLSHVQADLAQAARSAGCDMVLARSAFTQQLPALLRKLAGMGGPETERS